VKFLLSLIFVLFSSPAFAARLPHIAVSAEQWEIPAEDVLQAVDRTSEIQFWNAVVNLKTQLLSLAQQSDPSIPQEADRLAKRVISRIYQLSQEYRVVAGPHFQNFLIKLHIRQRGYCYHYTEDLLKDLTSSAWQHYQFFWAEAAEGTQHESNSVVITARGMPFETGLAVDAWRKGGKPFWILVKDDQRWDWHPYDYQQLRPLNLPP